MEPKPGLLLDDRYVLLAPCEGLGNGPTWQASEADLPERRWTVKLLGPVAGDALPPALVDHLQALRGLRHPGVLATVSHGVFEGTPYLVQSPLDGLSLRAHLAACAPTAGPWPTAALVALFRSVADAVIAAHTAARPVVHGDLHPDVVVIAPSAQGPVARVLDFGLAPFLPPAAALARADFVAPEQRAAQPSAPTADVFSLARLLAAMLDEAGLDGPPPARPPSRRRDVPEAVWDALDRATATHPAQRFATVAELLAALTRAWQQPLPATPAPPAPPALPVAPALPALPVAPVENPWATDARLRPFPMPEGFPRGAIAPRDTLADEAAAATEVMAPWSLPKGSAERIFEVTGSIASFAPPGAPAAPAAALAEEATARLAPFAAVEPPDEATVRRAPFRLDPPPATSPASPRTVIVPAALGLLALAALAALAVLTR